MWVDQPKTMSFAAFALDLARQENTMRMRAFIRRRAVSVLGHRVSGFAVQEEQASRVMRRVRMLAHQMRISDWLDRAVISASGLFFTNFLICRIFRMTCSLLVAKFASHANFHLIVGR